jgi:hypothetical protein
MIQQPRISLDTRYFLCVAGPGVAAAQEARLLRHYHAELSARIAANGVSAPSWEHLNLSLSLSYCDFARFLSGWGWWGHDLEALVIPVLDGLDHGRPLASEAACLEAMQREFLI